MTVSKTPADRESRRRSTLEYKTLIEADEALVAVVTEQLVSPQRVKVSPDDLDCSGNVSENI